MTELQVMTNAALTEHYNDLAFDVGQDKIGPWKGKKSDLIARIEDLKFEVGDMGKPTAKDEKSRTVRAAAIEFLCHVTHHENRDEPAGPDNVVEAGHDKARSVGLPYDEIIRLIKEEFPASETTAACLRLYAVKIRVEEHGYEGLHLPQRRPRVKPRKKA